MPLWTFRRPFQVEGRPAEVVERSGFRESRSTLLIDGRVVDEDVVTYEGGLRMHRLTAVLPDGRRLEVETGSVNALTIGIAARLDGRLIHESHPGRPLGGLEARMGDWVARQESPEAKAEQARMKERWRRNWPSLATDLALGLGFFLVAREWGLTAAALSGAAAGVVLYAVQRLTRVDLLGGLAVFGIVMSLISAGFAWAFQDEDIIKHRGTILGLLTAGLFAADGLTGGRRLAGRLSRYLMHEVDLRRLGLGMGGIGALMAGINAVVAEAASTDQWLVYTTFLDTLVAVALFLLMLNWARRRPGEAAA